MGGCENLWETWRGSLRGRREKIFSCEEIYISNPIEEKGPNGCFWIYIQYNVPMRVGSSTTALAISPTLVFRCQLNTYFSFCKSISDSINRQEFLYLFMRWRKGVKG